MIVRKIPYNEIKLDAQVLCRIISKILPTAPTNLHDRPESVRYLWSLCLSCWNAQSDERPEMFCILDDVQNRVQCIA